MILYKMYLKYKKGNQFENSSLSNNTYVEYVLSKVHVIKHDDNYTCIVPPK